jgi:serine/threonine protein kinase, bacterial
MREPAQASSLLPCFATYRLINVTPIRKESPEASAWFASTGEHDLFCKLYPHEYAETRAAIEIAIAGANLHPAIVPLRQIAACPEGMLLLYDRVAGENLGPIEARGRFQALLLDERIRAVSAIFAALTAISEAGFMLVDWYEGNMIYDFAQKYIWLFDWELCRRGAGFTLDMNSNYGSSRLMAPEEFIRGSWLDQQTLVFNLGRYALLTLPELAERAAPILARATYPARSGRYQSIQEFTQAFTEVI